MANPFRLRYKSRGPSSTFSASVVALTSRSRPSRWSRRVNIAKSPPGVRSHCSGGRSQYSPTPLSSSNDGVHLNAKGSASMGQQVAAQVLKVLGDG